MFYPEKKKKKGKGAGGKKSDKRGKIKDINKSSYPGGIVLCKAFNSLYA